MSRFQTFRNPKARGRFIHEGKGVLGDNPSSRCHGLFSDQGSAHGSGQKQRQKHRPPAGPKSPTARGWIRELTQLGRTTMREGP